MGGTWKRALVSDVLAANLACDACHVLEVVLCAAIDVRISSCGTAYTAVGIFCFVCLSGSGIRGLLFLIVGDFVCLCLLADLESKCAASGVVHWE